MLFLDVILAGLPLTLAFGPVGLQAYKIQRENQVGQDYNPQIANPQISKHPSAPSTLETKTRKYIHTPVPNEAGGSPPSPDAPSPSPVPLPPDLLNARPFPLPHPAEDFEPPTETRKYIYAPVPDEAGGSPPNADAPSPSPIKLPPSLLSARPLPLPHPVEDYEPPTTTTSKTRKSIYTPVPDEASGGPPSPDAPSPSPVQLPPSLLSARPFPLPHPTEDPSQRASQRCGSRGFPPCPNGQVCVDNPFVDGCYTALDCPGYCAVLDDAICGPVFEVACPIDAQVCVHDPREDCFGKECPGTCVFLDTELIEAAVA